MTRNIISYARGGRLARGPGRALVPPALVVVTIVAALVYGPHRRPDLWSRSPAAYWDAWRIRAAAAQCAQYVAPPDQVVYEEGPAVRRDWVTGGGGFFEKHDGQRLIRARRPQCLDRMHPGSVTAPELAAVFLHEMQAPDGTRRLVVMHQSPSPYHPGSAGIGWSPATGGSSGVSPLRDHDAFRRAAIVRWNYYLKLFPRLNAEQVLRVYAGQPDPKDTARFTVRYELDGQSGTFDVQLCDDGTMVIRPRDGPAVELWRLHRVAGEQAMVP